MEPAEDPSLEAAIGCPLDLDEADDVVDEVNYYRFPQQFQGVAMDEPEGVHRSEQVDDTSRGISDVPSSGGGNKRWSKAYDDFHVIEENGKPEKARCKHCLTEVKCGAKNGTSGMRNHNKVCKKKPAPNDQPPNPSSAADATTDATPVAAGNSSNRKRRRTDEESAQITAANTRTPWDKAELSNRIQKITSQLQDIQGELRELLKLHGPDSATSSNHYRNSNHLEVLNPLPPSIASSELLIRGVSTLPTIKRPSSGMLCIGLQPEYDDDEYDDDCHDEMFDESSDQLRILDDKILAFHYLRSLRLMIIRGCRNLMSISFEGFSHLVSLKSLKIYRCPNIFSLEDMPAGNCKAFPSLESLTIKACGIAGKWLPLMLRHAPVLEELILEDCPHITTLLSMEEEENTAREDSSSGNPDGALTGLAPEGFLHIPLNPISSLKKITVVTCPLLTIDGSKESLSVFTALEKLVISFCPEMFFSLVHNDGNDDLANGRWLLPQSLGELIIVDYSEETLQLCFPRNLTCLKRLEVFQSSSLISLQLDSCTALEELMIWNCQSLTALEGLRSLGSLTHLEVKLCRDLPPWSESFSRAGYATCLRLETLLVDDPSFLTTSLCKHLTSLQHLRLSRSVLTDEQKRALVLLKSLQELEFYFCHLVDLPAGLHTLPSLKTLKIFGCSGISRLPETALPPSLEELEIGECSEELRDQCRLLATSKLNVKIT